jgi:hypothetical protein
LFFLPKLNKIFPFCQTVTFVKSRKLINKNTISLLSKLNVSEIHNEINIANFCPIHKMLGLHYIVLYVTTNIKFFL